MVSQYVSKAQPELERRHDSLGGVDLSQASIGPTDLGSFRADAQRLLAQGERLEQGRSPAEQQRLVNSALQVSKQVYSAGMNEMQSGGHLINLPGGGVTGNVLASLADLADQQIRSGRINLWRCEDQARYMAAKLDAALTEAGLPHAVGLAYKHFNGERQGHTFVVVNVAGSEIYMDSWRRIAPTTDSKGVGPITGRDFERGTWQYGMPTLGQPPQQ